MEMQLDAPKAVGSHPSAPHRPVPKPVESFWQRVTKQLGKACCPVILLLLAPSNALAQAASTLGIFVGPPVPVAGQAYTIRGRGATDSPPVTVENITVARSGDFVDITFFINHGSDFTSPAAYAGTVAGPDLPAGTYTFRQFVRERYFGQGGYSDPPVLQYSKTVVVTNASNVGEAVEYYNSNLHHYFMTASSNEIAALDAGVFSGWSRTGQVFPGLYLGNPSTDAAITPVAPVCRYYGVPSAGLDTHFFTAFATECAVIPQLWPNSWILETPNAFYVSLPNITDGSCPDGTIPLYRLFNGRPDVNHRYTTSLEIRQQMIDQQWIPEGYGAIGVGMCING